MSKPTLNDIQAIMDKMYAVPHVLEKIMEVVTYPDTDIKAVEFALKHDPSFTTRLLKIANSSYYGSRGLLSVKDAVLTLGFDYIKEMVIQLTVKQLVDRSLSRKSTLIRSIWKHSIGVAVCARLLARELKKTDAESYFTAGVLHDVGLLLEYLVFPELFESIETAFYAHDEHIIEKEEAIFDFNHVLVGGLFVESWKLPNSLMDKIKYHHNPENADNKLRNSVYIMMLADVLSLRISDENSSDTLTDRETAALQATGIDESMLVCILPLMLNEANSALLYFD